MSDLPSIVKPEVKYDERVRANPVQEWLRQQDERSNPTFRLSNIHWLPDPLWRNHLVSIQSAHDWQRSLFWTCVAYAFFLAQFAVTLQFVFGMVRR